jgi:penicillin-insensitive murein endopeptidase
VVGGFFLGYCTWVVPPPAITEISAAVEARYPALEPLRVVPVLPPADTLVSTFQDHYFPFLDDEIPTSSVSVGTVTNGYLVGGSVLALPGRTYDILPRQSARGLMYGTEELVGLLTRVADVLHARHGTLLWLGNIGRRGGGDIQYSVSHNSGRDADIAFCYMDAVGDPVVPPDLVALDDGGVSPGHDGRYRFDAARTWTVVEALLTDEEAQVQYLFIANSLKRLLLQHARRSGARRSLLARADLVMGQPGLAAPHNDHLHLRLYCSRDDVEGGCVNTGKVHPGVDLFKGSKVQRVREMVGRLKDPQPEQRARAVERLVLLKARARLPEIVRSLDDPSARVRSAAAQAVGRLGSAADVVSVAERFEKEDTALVQRALVLAAGQLGGERSGRLLAGVIGDPGYDDQLAGPMPVLVVASFVRPGAGGAELILAEGSDDEVAVNGPLFEGVELALGERQLSVRLAAVEAAANLERSEPVPALVEALSSDDPVLRARAARALGRVTNHRFNVAWASPDLSVDDRAQGVEAWRNWWKKHQRRGRNGWLALGFRARGYPVPRLKIAFAWELVRAIRDDDHLSYNAQRALMRLTNHRPGSLRWSRSDACWHWTRWLDRHRREFRLPEAPASLADCNR